MSDSSFSISVEGLTVRRDGRAILDEITLRLAPTESVAIIGPNGAGKTTLMRCLLGLLRPTAGCVQLEGRPAHAAAPRWRGQRLSYVAQTVDRLPPFSVWDVIADGRYPHLSALRPLGENDQRVVSEAVAECGLAGLEGRLITTLSAGERQKAFIAAALAQDARVMLMDEPAAPLDPAHRHDLVRLLRSWYGRGRGLVMISHDLELPAATCERVIALREGRVVADGPVSQVLDPKVLADVYGAAFETARTGDGKTYLVPKW